MRIGELAASVGVNVETLRYYERRGLLEEPDRLSSGYRAYPPESVRVVRFIKRAQQLGFTLADVEELLRLAEGGPQSCDAARRLAAHRIADLDRRIAHLGAMRSALGQLADTCDRAPAERECPLVQAIEEPT